MISSYKEFKSFLEKLDKKPSLLLQCCCAPCSSHTLLLLKKYFNISVFYTNDNIYPKAEYDTRLEELRRFIKEIGDIGIIECDYNPSDYYEAIKGKENLGEKSIRCYECYKLRLDKTAKAAKEYNFDYFTTTLSISPYKVTKWINELGYEMENRYGVKFLFSDFKKDSGYTHSIELSKEYGLYRQDYCGCEFSIKERDEANASIKEEN